MFELAIGELATIVGGRLALGAMPPVDREAAPVGRVVTDSRTVEPGDVFWALRGPHHDGANFADEAYGRGATGVVAGRHIEPWAGCWSIAVREPRRALWQLAAALRRRFAGEVVAVTGSVGKTTTRQMIHAALGARLTGSASPQNYNNRIGLPLSMLGWSPLDDYAVVELGASAAGEIGELAGLAQPHVGVITCVGEAHLAGFGSREAVARAKLELLSTLESNGTAVLNGDDPWLRRGARNSRAKVVWFGRSADCDITASEVRSGRGMVEFCVERRQFRVPVWGRHYLTAALAAVAVGRVLGLSLDELSAALAEFAPPPGRCQVVRLPHCTIVNDCYNANPTSMRAALELLRDLDVPGRRVVVCGDMRELGGATHQAHRQLGEQVVNVCGADLLVAVGQSAEDVVAGAYEAGMPRGCAATCDSTDEAADAVPAMLQPGDVVLVKGSRAMAMEKLVEVLASPEEVVQAA